jgi:hypothetical protein
MRSAIEAHIAPSGAIIGGDWEVGATGLGVDFWPIDRLELGGAPRSKAAATFTPVGLVADLWYYLYAKADGATGIAFEALSQADPANAPDLTLTWKSDGAGGVDRTRRYLGCVRTWNDAGTVRMLRARKLGRVYRYLEAVIAANRLMVINGLNSAGAWSAVQDCSTRIPPTSLQARLLLAISGAGGSPWVRLTDDTADGDKAHLRAIATAHTDLWGEVWCPVSPAQGVYVYTTAGDGGLAVSAHVLGFEE